MNDQVIAAALQIPIESKVQDITHCPRCKNKLSLYYSSIYNNTYICKNCPKLNQTPLSYNESWLEISISENDEKVSYCNLNIPGFKITYVIKKQYFRIYNFKTQSSVAFHACLSIDLIYKSDEEILLWIQTMYNDSRINEF